MTPASNPKPADFESYWSSTLAELSQISPAPVVEPMPMRTSGDATMYGVRLTSIGPYRLFGYLSIPRGRGPFPAILQMPNYGSVLEPLPQGTALAKRRRYVTFAIAVRGQRNADQPFAALFPGLLTEGIEDHLGYIFRGIVADCCRGAEYLFSRPEVDPGRVTAAGSDLALITAALNPRISHAISTPGLFFATCAVASKTKSYPLEEINDYLRYRPESRDKVEKTLGYFDLRWFAPQVKATTLLVSGGKGELLGPEALQPVIEALGSQVTVYETQHSTYKDGLYTERWLARQMGFRQAILPDIWR
ncbi:MAG: acetylxylan esterase [Chloroflexi bacterium]|nr:acetylxylan esterase [Chloroflexota bacterium]